MLSRQRIRVTLFFLRILFYSTYNTCFDYFYPKIDGLNMENLTQVKIFFRINNQFWDVHVQYMETLI
jgi:hypothetical protein